MPVQLGVGYIDIRPDFSGFGRDLKKGLGRDLATAGDDGGKKLGDSMSRSLKRATAGLGAIAVGNFLKDAVGAASDLNESLNKSNAVFGRSGKTIEVWAQGGAKNFGLSKRAALDAAGTFGNMFAQLGFASDQAAQMSTSMVELAADFASFHNADISEVVLAQASAFRGEYDALQRYLPLINAATVEQKALSITGKSAAKELTAQDKALAVNRLMMEGAGDAAGDFSRTSGELANRMRILGAEWANNKAALGEGLLPALNSAVGILNDSVIPGFKELFTMGGNAESFASHIQDFVSDILGSLIGIFNVAIRGLANVIGALPFGWGDSIANDLRESADAADDLREKLHASKAEIQGWATQTLNAASAQKILATATAATVRPLTLQQIAVQENTKASRDSEAAQRTLQRAQWDYDKLLKQTAIDEEAVADARKALSDATRSAAHADRDLAEAQERFDAAQANANDLKGWDTAQDELADATLGLADAQAEAADAHDRAAEAEAALRTAEAGDPDYQNKLADARDRVAESTEKIAAAADKVTATGAALNTWAATVGAGLDALGLKADLLLPKFEALAGHDTGNILAGIDLNATPIPAGLRTIGNTMAEDLNSPEYGTPIVRQPWNPPGSKVNNVTINVTQTDPNPKNLSREMMWALD